MKAAIECLLDGISDERARRSLMFDILGGPGEARADSAELIRSYIKAVRVLRAAEEMGPITNREHSDDYPPIGGWICTKCNGGVMSNDGEKRLKSLEWWHQVALMAQLQVAFRYLHAARWYGDYSARDALDDAYGQFLRASLWGL